MRPHACLPKLCCWLTVRQAAPRLSSRPCCTYHQSLTLTRRLAQIFLLSIYVPFIIAYLQECTWWAALPVHMCDALPLILQDSAHGRLLASPGNAQPRREQHLSGLTCTHAFPGMHAAACSATCMQHPPACACAMALSSPGVCSNYFRFGEPRVAGQNTILSHPFTRGWQSFVIVSNYFFLVSAWLLVRGLPCSLHLVSWRC